ncbi:MAG: hypothetical protein ACW980_22510 [Promethearchaeota archaeon]|jgi:hypothetical protein
MYRLLTILILTVFLTFGCSPKKAVVTINDDTCTVCNEPIVWTIRDNVYKIIAEYTCGHGFVHPDCLQKVIWEEDK